MPSVLLDLLVGSDKTVWWAGEVVRVGGRSLGEEGGGAGGFEAGSVRAGGLGIGGRGVQGFAGVKDGPVSSELPGLSSVDSY